MGPFFHAPDNRGSLAAAHDCSMLRPSGAAAGRPHIPHHQSHSGGLISTLGMWSGSFPTFSRVCGPNAPPHKTAPGG